MLLPVAWTKGTEFSRAPRHPARDITYFDRFGLTTRSGPGPSVVPETCTAKRRSASDKRRIRAAHFNGRVSPARIRPFDERTTRRTDLLLARLAEQIACVRDFCTTTIADQTMDLASINQDSFMVKFNQGYTGTVNVNEAYAAAWGSIDAPMGGMGDSGLGRRHGAVGILKYTETQTIARQRLMNLAPPLQRLGDDGFARVMTTALSLMKKAGWR